MQNILVPVSPGEVLDKITILEIKAEHMSDREKLANVHLELGLLQETWKRSVIEDEVTQELRRQLREINRTLWTVEDEIREKERSKTFDRDFIELARRVYFTNDQRSRVKRELNLHLGSLIVEEKSYQAY